MSSKTKARGMILAAGFGSRLGALGQGRPKPMLPVCGAPLVQWVLEWMASYGIEDIVINLHHLGERIEAALGDGSRFGVKIQYSRESPIMGTGGGLREARRWLDPGDGAPIVIANGKLIQDINLDGLLEQHQKTGAEATMVLRKDLEGVWGASLAYAPKTQSLTEFLGEKSDAYRPEDERVMFSGVHVVSPRFLDRIPAQGAPCIARSAYAEHFAQKGRIDALLHQGYWWEHSTPERYLQGVTRVLGGEIDGKWCPGGQICGVHERAKVHEGARVDPQAWVGPDVEIAQGAHVGAGCQLLEGAKVQGGAQLERCVVLEGVTVQGTHRDEVVA